MRKKSRYIFQALLLIIFMMMMSCQKEAVQKDNTDSRIEAFISKIKIPDSGPVKEALYQKKDERIRNQSSRRMGVIKVPDDFPTIQMAVDAAMPGTNIKVDPGTYNEIVNVVVDNISITGKSGAVLVGAFIMISSNTEIKGFRIEMGPYIHGIHVIDSEEVNITDNIVIGDGVALWGIFLDACSQSKVRRNKATLTTQGGILSLEGQDNIVIQNETSRQLGGSGITLWGTTGNLVKSNISNNNSDGGIILLLNAKFNEVIGNEFLGNSLCDIIIGPTATDNEFRMNVFDCVDE